MNDYKRVFMGAIASLLWVGANPVKAELSDRSGLARAEGPSFDVLCGEGQRESLRIKSPPFGVQTLWLYYRPDKYVQVERYDLHVFGTPSSSDWMVKESCDLVVHMISAIKRPEDRAKFSGHQLFCITDEDPDLIGSREGHRNTGMKGGSLFNEVLVCAMAVDSIRPGAAPVYRAWDTPVHEFGHAIEHTLGLESRSDEIYSKNVKNYNPKVAREYFAWATQRWFNSSGGGRGREGFARWEYDYLASIFSADNCWVPVDADGPDCNVARWDASKKWPALTSAELAALEGTYRNRSARKTNEIVFLRVAERDSSGAPVAFVLENQSAETLTFYPDSIEWVLKTDRDAPCYANRIKSGKELYVKIEPLESDGIRPPAIGLWFRGEFFVKEG